METISEDYAESVCKALHAQILAKAYTKFFKGENLVLELHRTPQGLLEMMIEGKLVENLDMSATYPDVSSAVMFLMKGCDDKDNISIRLMNPEDFTLSKSGEDLVGNYPVKIEISQTDEVSE